jgi:hypothetical protein
MRSAPTAGGKAVIPARYSWTCRFLHHKGMVALPLTLQ